VRHHDHVEDLFDALRARDVGIVVMDVADAEGRSMASTVAAVRHRFPTVPLLGYCSITGRGSSAMVEAVRAGATGLLVRGIDDERFAIRSAISSARRATITERIQDELAPHVPPSIRPLLRYALCRSPDEPSVEDAARSLGLDRKTIFNCFKDSKCAQAIDSNALSRADGQI
jgi:DNA-binding NarL/FixJ family response regulator